MRHRLLLAASLIALLATGPFLGRSLADTHGARCPSGAHAAFKNGVLTCTRTHHDVADVSCPPQSALLNVELVVTPGRDKCKVPGTPVNSSLPNAGCFALPFDQGWKVDSDAGGTIRDRCVRTRVESVSPELF